MFVYNTAMPSDALKAKILETSVAYTGFFELRRLTVVHDLFNGGTTGPLVREVLHRRRGGRSALLTKPRIKSCLSNSIVPGHTLQA